MPESGPAALAEYKELFQELGTPEGMVTLRRIHRAATAYAPAVSDEIPLYKVLVDDSEDRQSFGLMVSDRRVFRIWGGAISPTGILEVTESSLNQARLAGGGVLENGILFNLMEFHRGFSVGGIVMQYFLLCDSLKLVL